MNKNNSGSFKTIKRGLRSILSLTFVIILLTGCGFNETSELMSGARDFIEQGDYEKAMTNLSKVLDEDESNLEARGMYYQAMKLQKAEKARFRKDYQQEVKELQDLLNDNSGSAKIRNQAEEKLEKAKKAYNRQQKAVITRKENAKKTADENKGKYAYGSVYGQKQVNTYYKKEKSTETTNEQHSSENVNSNAISGDNNVSNNTFGSSQSSGNVSNNSTPENNISTGTSSN